MEKFIKKVTLEFNNGDVEIIEVPTLVVLPNHGGESMSVHVSEGITREDVGEIGNTLYAYGIGEIEGEDE
jgi:hypothetical protein